MNHYSAAKHFGISEEDIINIDGRIIHEQMNKHRTNSIFGVNVVTDETLTRKIANIIIKRHNLNETDAMALANDRMKSVRNSKRINKAILFIVICAITFWIQS
ncbi:hypothetical protein DKW60_00990 [Leucothrix pacifica]|uniref:Uncharacterized protein n=1 Tax=Leucothrix pacifica TaxID=1247513 RepID=A0A317CV92_9GAMM|nr:hypothetical protein DKW60_00990 [Leucothrix pacifica]